MKLFVKKSIKVINKVVKSGKKWYICFTKKIVMLNLIGVYECKVDAKGILMLASALKKQLLSVLNDGFIIKRSVFYKCLELYPMNVWNSEVEGINRLNRFIRKNNDFIRLFMAGVKTVELDGNGRLLIPRDLIKFAKVKKQIVLASAVNRIEIWDKNNYEKVLNDDSIDFAKLAEEVMGKNNQKDNDVIS